MDQTAVDAIVAAVDFTTIIAGVGTIAAAVGLVKVAMVGASLLLRAVRGG